jgi:hypothetical protein
MFYEGIDFLNLMTTDRLSLSLTSLRWKPVNVQEEVRGETWFKKKRTKFLIWKLYYSHADK